jgi:hypothetical protein
MELRNGVIAAVLLISSGCGTSVTNPSAPAPPVAAAPQARNGPGALRPLILVADFSGNAALGYPLTAKGNAAPAIDVNGKLTGLGHADNIALDAASNIYISINDKTIGVYAANANGDARRIRKIGGSNTQLSFPIGVAVDSKGHLYVADCGNGDVKVFASRANGNVAPIRVIGLTTGCTIEEAVDAKDDLYVTSGDNVISEFSSYAHGNNPIRQIDEKEASPGVGVRSVAIDSQGNLYAGNLLAKDIRVFSPSASGTASPIRTIAGSQTHLGAPTGIALDDNDDLYVTICEFCHQGSGTDSVLIFPPKAKGNIKPKAVIVGSKTELNAPTDLAVRD